MNFVTFEQIENARGAGYRYAQKNRDWHQTYSGGRTSKPQPKPEYWRASMGIKVRLADYPHADVLMIKDAFYDGIVTYEKTLLEQFEYGEYVRVGLSRRIWEIEDYIVAPHGVTVTLKRENEREWRTNYVPISKLRKVAIGFPTYGEDSRRLEKSA